MPKPQNVFVELKKDEDLEHMLMRFNKKIRNQKYMEEINSFKFYEKASVINRRKRNKRKYVSKFYDGRDIVE